MIPITLRVSKETVRLIILLSAFIFYHIQLLTNWPLINWAGFRGENRYIDLNSVLKSAECFKDNNLGIYSDVTETPCAGYMYGRSLIYLIQVFRLDPDMTLLIGSTSVILGIFTFISLLKKSMAPNSIILALSFTPGISLLFERGNIDLFITLIVISASMAFRLNHFSFSIFLLLIASSLKFYTLPLVFIAILMARQSKVARVFWSFIALILTVNVIEQVFSSPKVPGTWFISFGIQVFAEYVNLGFRLASQEVRLHQALSIVLSASLIFLSIFLQRSRYRAGTARKESGISTSVKFDVAETIGLFSFIVFLSCYITGISYDYRIIFYVLALSGLPLVWFQEKKLLKTLVIVSLLFSTIFAPNLIGPRVIFQFAGDIAMLAVLPSLFGHYFEIIRRTKSDVR